MPEPELRALEEGNASALRPRTLHQLATFYRTRRRPCSRFRRSPRAGIPELDDAAVQFATKSDDISKLTPEERKKPQRVREILQQLWSAFDRWEALEDDVGEQEAADIRAEVERVLRDLGNPSRRSPGSRH